MYLLYFTMHFSIILVAAFVGQGRSQVATTDTTCPLLAPITTFLIPTNSPIGRFNMLLIKFNTTRKLPFSSTAFYDQLNSQKNLNRASVAEPFTPMNQTCSSLSMQFNCTGGISMTDSQKVKASPRYTWDRGHLTPANPMRFSEEALNKTFYCVNLAPQDSWTNQNSWMNIEVFVENKLKSIGSGYVMTGLCSEDNLIDGGKTYKGYGLPACFWKMACYRNTTTKKVHVVGYIGNNTIVNFADLKAQGDRNITTFQPRSQSEILKVTNPALVAEGWKEAESYLLPGRQASEVAVATSQECIAASNIDSDIVPQWKL